MMPAYIGQRQTEKVVQDESQTTFRLKHLPVLPCRGS